MDWEKIAREALLAYDIWISSETGIAASSSMERDEYIGARLREIAPAVDVDVEKRLTCDSCNDYLEAPSYCEHCMQTKAAVDVGKMANELAEKVPEQDMCPACEGFGFYNIERTAKCSHCDGSGRPNFPKWFADIIRRHVSDAGGRIKEDSPVVDSLSAELTGIAIEWAKSEDDIDVLEEEIDGRIRFFVRGNSIEDYPERIKELEAKCDQLAYRVGEVTVASRKLREAFVWYLWRGGGLPSIKAANEWVDSRMAALSGNKSQHAEPLPDEPIPGGKLSADELAEIHKMLPNDIAEYKKGEWEDE